MHPRAELTLFEHVVKRPESELDLGQAALLIAEAEQPGLDVAHWVSVLDEMGSEVEKRIGEPPRSDAENDSALQTLLGYLYGDLHFRGNVEDYYDPRNSYLNQVLERRLGIPITLAVVLLEVARRAGISVRGVSFPGHFLVRAPSAHGPRFVDPFDGSFLGAAELRALHVRATGQDGDPDPRLLEPTEKQQILVRMLNNLRAIWSQRGDRERLRSIEERIAILSGGRSALPSGRN
jgi:regulator of sirC expression with transglutaminase-like and TPR domain